MHTKSCIALIVSLITLNAAAEKRGAKAIFVDTTSGAEVQASKAQPSSRPVSRSHRSSRTSQRAAPAVPEVAGLMYYLELVSPSGERSRVTADHTFHSGDRILVHVMSSIDGNVAVFQHEPDGRTAQLFPDPRINGGSGYIARRVDAILPSPTAWFRFDDQPGTERLSIVLTPPPARAAPQQVASVTTSSLDHLRASGGSKGLVVETENSGPAQATYVVRPMQDGRTVEPLVVEIALRHQ